MIVCGIDIPSVWLVGKGMLGKELSLLLNAQSIHYTTTGHEIDISDLRALRIFASEKRFSWIVNCAAYTAVDKAEDEAEICLGVNALGAGNLAEIAAEWGAKLVHISTDYVFEGKGNHPYREDDAPCPECVYGKSKLEGERLVFQKHKASYILRTAWLYGEYGRNFVRTMLKMMDTRESVTVVNDQRGTPTWTFDLASAIVTLMREAERKTVPYGVYHYTDGGECTWFGFAQKIEEYARELGLLRRPCAVLPCTSAEFPVKAKRPAYSVLDKSKIKKMLGLKIPSWEESLKFFLTNHKERESL